MKFLRLALLGGAAVFSMAVTPMSPKLDAVATKQTVDALMRAGLTEVATSSVLRSLEQVIGIGDEERTFEYREPYDHLAQVDAASKFARENCIKTDLTIWMRKQPDKRVTLVGVFCKADPMAMDGDYRWTTPGIRVEGSVN